MGKFVISSDGTNYIPNNTDEIWHEPMMKDDYHKATPFITEAGAREEAKRRCTKPFKIVKKSFVK